MCNFLHKNSTPITKRGVGWKIFRPCLQSYQNSKDIRSLQSYQNSASPKHIGSLFSRSKYSTNKGRSVIWGYGYFGDGFCFFLTKGEAEKALNLLIKSTRYENYSHMGYGISAYSSAVIVKITYEDGIGQHLENNMVFDTNLKIAICKKFRVHKDEKKYKL